MIKKLTFAVAALLLAGVAGCRFEHVKEATVVAPEVRNAACLQVVSNALAELRVRDRVDLPEVVSADFSTGAIVIRYDSMEMGTKNLEDAIAGAGFAAGPFPANKEAAAKLPAGCRGVAD